MTIDLLYELVKSKKIDIVVGLESRGFLMGPPLALKLGAGFVMVRKPGKLPYKTISYSYLKEYGKDTLMMHEDSFAPG
jgi:adenine phosphoribosyltransferase